MPKLILDPVPAAARAIRLARRGDSLALEEGELGDMQRDAVIDGLPLWLALHRGWLYLAGNAAWPGLYKVGCTRKSVQKRLAELDGAGLPTPWHEVRSWGAYDAHGLEAKAHALCEPWRFRGELFRADPVQLANAVDTANQADRAQLMRHLGPILIPGRLKELLDEAAGTPTSTSDSSYTSVGHNHNGGIHGS